MPKRFVNEVREVAKKFAWIKRINSRIVGKVARIRLWINDSFKDVYYNSELGTTSYAYVENEKRIFGANNMRIGWHLHPFGELKGHKRSESMRISEFLKILEKQLKKKGRI